MCIVGASEHEVHYRFGFVAACQASGATRSTDTVEVLVYWSMHDSELRDAA